MEEFWGNLCPVHRVTPACDGAECSRGRVAGARGGEADEPHVTRGLDGALEVEQCYVIVATKLIIRMNNDPFHLQK